jgi:hypothetical protein
VLGRTPAELRFSGTSSLFAQKLTEERIAVLPASVVPRRSTEEPAAAERRRANAYTVHLLSGTLVHPRLRRHTRNDDRRERKGRKQERLRVEQRGGRHDLWGDAGRIRGRRVGGGVVHGVVKGEGLSCTAASARVYERDAGPARFFSSRNLLRQCPTLQLPTRDEAIRLAQTDDGRVKELARSRSRILRDGMAA